MRRWHPIVFAFAGLVFTAAGARGQPAPLPQPAVKPAASQPRPGAGKAEPAEAKAALARARRAREQAQCLRGAAVRVDVAARRLRWARSAKAVTDRRTALRQALASLDQCWDAAFDDTGSGLGSVPPPPSVLPQQPPKRAHFGFGQIRVEGGPLDRYAVARPLRVHAERYRGCYDRALRRSPNLAGEVHFRLYLTRERDHAVPTSVAIPESSLRDEATRRCLAQALMTTAFPPQADGATISLMMAFATVTR